MGRPALRILTDHDFRASITRGLVRRLPDLDVLTLHRAGLAHVEDEDVLRLAARESRLLLTHDTRTMPRALKALSEAGEEMPRVVYVPQRMPIGVAVEELALILSVATDDDWSASPLRLPL